MISLLEACKVMFGKTENFTKEEQDILRSWINGDFDIIFTEDDNEEDDE